MKTSKKLEDAGIATAALARLSGEEIQRVLGFVEGILAGKEMAQRK